MRKHSVIKTSIIGIILTVVALPVHSQDCDDNYVRTTVPLDSSGMSASVSVTYYDGLGRSVGTSSTSPVDGTYTHIAVSYDMLGRPTRETLPYTFTSLSPSLPAAMTMLAALPGQYGGDTRPWTDRAYDGLDRDTSATGPGTSWSGHPSTVWRGTNATGEVALYRMSGSDVTRQGSYPPKSLTKETSTDEDGRAVTVFKDLRGLTVLERRGTLDTYYVYDARGQLRYVLPPAASAAMTGNGTWSATSAAIDQYAYAYRYDSHGQCIWKKLPGCTCQEMWYDSRGHLCFSDDGDLRAGGKRRFYVCDMLGRPALSGVCSSAGSVPGNISDLVIQAQMTGSGQYGGYSVPLSLSGVSGLTITYYDDYSFLCTLPQAVADSVSFRSSTLTPYHSPAIGRITGRRTYLIDSDSIFEATAAYYDRRGRVVQENSSGGVRGTCRKQTQYTFTGNPQEVLTVRTPPRKATLTERYQYSYENRTDRLLSVTHSVNGSPPVTLASYTYDALGRVAAKVTGGLETTSYAYNIQSWPTKMQGPKFTELLAYEGASNGLTPSTPQWSGKVSAVRWYRGTTTIKPAYQFTYDGMGRLAEASYTQNTYLMNRRPKYTETYSYDAMGNVTALTRQGWLYGSTWGLIDDLTMEYEGNRLVKCDDAVSAQPTNNGAHHFQDLADEDEEYGYDQNGNMTEDLNRNITSIEYNILNLPEQISFSDRTKMKFTYDAQGSKLRAEYWTVPSMVGPIGPAGIGGGAEPMGGGIVGPINPINQNDPQVVTDYCGDMIYRNDTLTMLLTEEGYVTFDERGEPLYHYYLKDHLGSVRVVFDRTGTVEQVNDYYPSGTLMYTSTNGTVQPYKFGGKELERTLPLDEYDFGARWMDPVVGGRFTTMDPLCEKYYSVSPYAYCGGDPINAFDIDGKDYWYTNDQDQIIEFWNALGRCDSYFDFSGWEHATDAEITGNLVYNDETNKYYTSYIEIIDNEIYVIGKTFNAFLKPVTFTGKGYLGAYVYEPAKGSFQRFLGFLSGGYNYDDGYNNWNVNLDGRIIGYTPIYGVVDYNPALKSKAISNLIAKGARLIKKYGLLHNQKVYQLGNKYYSWDVDKHHGGVFKVLEQKGGKLKRIGTVDENLNIISK